MIWWAGGSSKNSESTDHFYKIWLEIAVVVSDMENNDYHSSLPEILDILADPCG